MFFFLFVLTLLCDQKNMAGKHLHAYCCLIAVF